jgi:hypothetical protein
VPHDTWDLDPDQLLPEAVLVDFGADQQSGSLPLPGAVSIDIATPSMLGQDDETDDSPPYEDLVDYEVVGEVSTAAGLPDTTRTLSSAALEVQCAIPTVNFFSPGEYAVRANMADGTSKVFDVRVGVTIKTDAADAARRAACHTFALPVQVPTPQGWWIVSDYPDLEAERAARGAETNSIIPTASTVQEAIDATRWYSQANGNSANALVLSGHGDASYFSFVPGGGAVSPENQTGEAQSLGWATPTGYFGRNLRGLATSVFYFACCTGYYAGVGFTTQEAADNDLLYLTYNAMSAPDVPGGARRNASVMGYNRALTHTIDSGPRQQRPALGGNILPARRLYYATIGRGSIVTISSPWQHP